MRSTMQDFQLTIEAILRHGAEVNGDGAGRHGHRRRARARSRTPSSARRAARLANALRALGVTGDQRVGTFQWNNAEHLEAYLAIPSMGAVLHTLNIRLFPEQLTYIANHAEDKVVIVDDSLVDLLAKQLPSFETVEHVVVAGPGREGRQPRRRCGPPASRCTCTRSCSTPRTTASTGPTIDERDAAAMCYTSGTTGNPKGVVYSHRSSYLHSMAVGMGITGGLTWTDRVLPIVPMFHANAWGLPYAALMTGASLIMPDRWLQAEPAVPVHAGGRGRPSPVRCRRSGTTCSATSTSTRTSTSSDHLRLVLCGGSAVPVALQKALDERHGIHMVQAWGMTETSPVASVARPPAGVEGDEEWHYRGGQGRLLPGLEGRIVGEAGDVLPARRRGGRRARGARRRG